MYIKLDESGVVKQVIEAGSGDDFDAALLVGFIEVDIEDDDVMLKSYDSASNTFSETSESIRRKRNEALASEVDPVVSNPLRWADMTTEQQNAWAQYRTDLLNITDQDGFPANVTWPTKP